MEAESGEVSIPKTDLSLPLSLLSGLRRTYKILRESGIELESEFNIIVNDINYTFGKYNQVGLLNPTMLILVHQLRRLHRTTEQRLETFLRWSERIGDLIGTGTTRGALVLDFIRYHDLYQEHALDDVQGQLEQLTL